MKDLSEVNLQLSQRIVAAMESGNELQEKGAYQAALEKYKEAWSMLPDPKAVGSFPLDRKMQFRGLFKAARL